MATKIYSPDGEPFEVAKSRVARLLLSGWTSTPPAVKEEPAVPARGRIKSTEPAGDAAPVTESSKED